MRLKYLLESDILEAMKHTLSNEAAARYLGVDKRTYKKYASIYITDDGSKTLYEAHKNPYGKGVHKSRLNLLNNKYNIEDLLAGKYPNFPIQRLKYKLINEGILKEKCEMCGFEERRITDMKVPLLLAFKDGDKKNWSLENLELLCYNHYFLFCGNIMGKNKEIELY